VTVPRWRATQYFTQANYSMWTALHWSSLLLWLPVSIIKNLKRHRMWNGLIDRSESKLPNSIQIYICKYLSPNSVLCQQGLLYLVKLFHSGELHHVNCVALVNSAPLAARLNYKKNLQRHRMWNALIDRSESELLNSIQIYICKYVSPNSVLCQKGLNIVFSQVISLRRITSCERRCTVIYTPLAARLNYKKKSPTSPYVKWSHRS